MADSANRTSALDGHVPSGHIGESAEVGVEFTVVRDVQVWQVAGWGDTLSATNAKVASQCGVPIAPGPGKAVVGSVGTALRIEPLKWWLLGCDAPALPSETGVAVDLSHARTWVRVSGDNAAALLMRHLPINLRDEAFPVGSVASSAFHHVGVTVWRSDAGYELFLPRGFALSLWEMLLESAAQFGARAAFA